jgi:hypothetical protein
MTVTVTQRRMAGLSTTRATGESDADAPDWKVHVQRHQFIRDHCSAESATVVRIGEADWKYDQVSP